MKNLVILIFAFFAWSGVTAQGCLPEGIEFYEQAVIDNFQTNYPGCTEIEGSVTITGGDITNLNGLSILTSIGGDLFIGNNSWPYGSGYPHLTSLAGLDNLASIGGDLYINRDSTISTLTGLQGLTSIGGSIFIWSNYMLTSLSGLENITSIPGELWISQNPLTNLGGIGNVSSIGGYLHIIGNGNLTSLSGLENLTSIGGGIQISENQALTSLGGLENLISIGGGIYIVLNQALTSLTGLDNLTSIGEDITIGWNNTLASLSGLENITSAVSGVYIICNASLTSLSGLDGLTFIEGTISIYNNEVLTSLTGLDNLTSIEGELWITENNSLSTCEALWVCGYLSNPSSSINIYGNAEGCNNPPEVADACGITPFCLPYGNYHFYSQADVDDFQFDYPDCTELEGDVRISGNDITNLNGLSVVTSIGNLLWMESNIVLTSLTGLDNVTSIGGDLFIYNSALTSLTGLDNVTSIGGSLNIGDEYVGGNPALTSLTGLNNLTSIGGELYVGWNNSLTSLTGLDNINAGSITILTIIQNTSLATCDVQSICNYLASANGNIYIWDNATGCKNQTEVGAACEAHGIDLAVGGQRSAVICYPNPTNGIVDLQFTVYNLQKITLKIYDVQGQEVAVVVDEEMAAGDHTVKWDASALPAGIYFYQLSTVNCQLSTCGKLVKY